MATVTVVLALAAATVARARYRGVPWIDIVAFPSQWFNWTFAGREFGETFSAFVGYQVREGAQPIRFWRTICLFIDMMFWARECHHCAESLHRLEKKSRENRRHS